VPVLDDGAEVVTVGGADLAGAVVITLGGGDLDRCHQL